MTITQDIRPTIRASAFIDAPFDKAKEALESEGYEVISLEENARLRIEQGKDSFVSTYGNWVRECFIVLPDEKTYLSKKSPVMKYPSEATEMYRTKNLFEVQDEIAQESLEDSIRVKDLNIPTNRFGENELIVYVFGKQAKDYGLFLQEYKVGKYKIEEMFIWLFVNHLITESTPGPIVKQIYFRDLGNSSNLDGSHIPNPANAGPTRGIKYNHQTKTKRLLK